MTRQHVFPALSAAALLALGLAPTGCGFSPTFTDGTIVCENDRGCPPGFECLSALCYRVSTDSGLADVPVAGSGGGPGTGGRLVGSGGATGTGGRLVGSGGETGTGTGGATGTGGSTCSTMCTPGEYRCAAGDMRQQCVMVSGCPSWGPEMPCPAPTTCQAANGSCGCPPRPMGCTSGAGTFCETPSTVATCQMDAQGCVAIAPMRTTCPMGRPCTGAYPAASCSCPAPPAACAAGAGTSCESSSSIVTCGLDASGCLGITSRTSCPMNRPCRGTAPNAACTCPPPPAGCSGSSSGSYCQTTTTLDVCGLDTSGCVQTTPRGCPYGCVGMYPSAMCCAPSCVGRCGGSDGCVGSCPNNCVSPQTCGGGGTPNVCGSPACGTLNVSGFSVQASSNGVYTRVGNTLVWENATRTIQYGMITSTYWEILQKPGAPGPSRPAICDKPTGAGASPAACSSGWLEWTGSASGFVSVPAVMTCQ